MSDVGSIKAKVSVPGKGNSQVSVQLTFQKICEWIKLQGLDDYTTNGLIQMASRYPTESLPSFRKNFNLMIERVRVKRRSEQQGVLTPEEGKNVEEITKG